MKASNRETASAAMERGCEPLVNEPSPYVALRVAAFAVANDVVEPVV